MERAITSGVRLLPLKRRGLLALGLAVPLWMAGCAGVPAPADPAVRTTLAPTGTLRVGVYPGSPTSMVRSPTSGEQAGVALELGRSLGGRLGVPVRVVEFDRLALVLEALKAGAVDFTFTNATEVRARDMDFTPPLVQLELGYLVPQGSAIAAVADVDRAGVRVGVSQGSSSQGVLTRTYKNATVVPSASLKEAQQSLQQRRIDAFATNKGILFEMADAVPGSQVLDGRWGVENLAIAVPKGRQAAMPYLRQFAQDVQKDGSLPAIVKRAGLRGTVAAAP